MKKITVHQYNSVSEYFLDDKKLITEVKYLSDNRTKDYVYDEKNPVYNSLIDLFNNNLISKSTQSKIRTINEYRQNKDNIYSYRYN